MSQGTTLDFSGKKGDLTVRFTHVDLKDGSGVKQPAMRIESRGKTMAAVVPLMHLYRFDPRDKDPQGNPEGLKLARSYADVIFGAPTTFDVHRVYDAIIEFADELKNMPPPPEQFKTRGEYLEHLERESWAEAKPDSIRIYTGA